MNREWLTCSSKDKVNGDFYNEVPGPFMRNSDLEGNFEKHFVKVNNNVQHNWQAMLKNNVFPLIKSWLGVYVAALWSLLLQLVSFKNLFTVLGLLPATCTFDVHPPNNKQPPELLYNEN